MVSCANLSVVEQNYSVDLVAGFGDMRNIHPFPTLGVGGSREMVSHSSSVDSREPMATTDLIGAGK